MTLRSRQTTAAAGGRRRRVTGLAVAAAGATAAFVAIGAPAHAALSTPGLAVSNNTVGATATYTATFVTGVAATDLIVTLPTGVSGLSATNVAVSSAATCGGTFTTLAATVVVSSPTVAVTPGTAPAVGTCVKVVVSGVTNPATVGTTYVCEADGTALAANVIAANLTGLTCSATGLAGGTLNLVVDNAAVALNLVAQATNGVTQSLSVAPVLTTALDNSYDSFSITPAAGGVEASSATQALTVKTNAQTYQLQAAVSGATSALTWQGGSTKTIPFGYTAATGASPAACSGSGTAFGTGGSYANIGSALTGLTNSQVTNINYCWNVDLTAPAGMYTATVTYLVVPSF